MIDPPRVTCYPQPGKQKAFIVCEAFAAGVRAAGGKAEVCTQLPAVLKEGDAFFYGVRPMHAHLWAQCKAERRTWIYADNSYFDSTRERYFRVTRNAIQHDGRGESSGRRFRELDLRVKPLRRTGTIVLACAQSAEFMQIVARDPDWLQRAVAVQRDRGEQILVRHKGERRPLEVDLALAKLLVTWSSAAAVGALLDGVPVQCSTQCCAFDVQDRQRWAEVLADNQFTISEMQSGHAWRQVTAGSAITAR